MTRGSGARPWRPTGRRAWPGRFSAAAAALAVVGTLFAVGEATAQGADSPNTSLRLTVTELSGVLGPGTVVQVSDDPRDLEPTSHELELRVLVENDGNEAMESLRLVVEVHPAVTTRGLLRQALRGTLLTRPIHVYDPAIRNGDALGPGDVAGVSASFSRDDVAWAGGAGGVHPLRISVTRGTDVLAEAVTAVVWLSERPETPLTTTLVWPLDTAPWRTVKGAYARGIDREIQPGGRLDALTRTLERSGSTSVVLAPASHLLEDVADRAEGFTALSRLEDGTLEPRMNTAASSDARVAARMLQRWRDLAEDLPHAPLTGSYADADLAALSGSDDTLRQLAAEAAVEGRRRLQRLLGREVDARTHLVWGPVEPGVLDLVPAENVLLPYAATAEPSIGANPQIGSPIRPLYTPSGRLLTALVADPYLEEALTDIHHPAGPVVATQRVVAETALAFLEAPGTTSRSLLLLPPPTWDPSAQVADRLLTELRSATWLSLSSPAALIEQGRPRTQPLDLAVPQAAPLSATLARELGAAMTGLTAASAALPEGTSRIDGRSASELRDTLLRASSRWYHDAEAEAIALVRDVQRAVDVTFGTIEVATGSVTLTSDTGQIPVTLQRSRGGPISIAVEVASQGRLLWPEGRRSETLVLEEGASQTVSFATQARSTGTFPVTVRVTDPSGEHELARTTLSVRSTAISGPALSATGGIILVLLLLGAMRRREKRPRLEVVE